MTTMSMLGSNRSHCGVRQSIEFLWYLAAFFVVIAMGALNLFFPFVADQTVALTGAKILSQGGTLYVDFWDNKMPGLFWFYGVAGALFGYTELGGHLLELLWMIVFSLVLMTTLRDYMKYPWMSAITPLAVVGVYYVAADPFHLTQLEILVGLPIFLSAWCASRSVCSGRALRSTFVASGLCAGVAVVFKLVFAPLFVVFWGIVSVHALRRRRLEVGEIILSIWLPAIIGVSAVIGAVALKFWFDGSLGQLYWTAFVYPPQALAATPGAPYVRLGESLLFFLVYYLAWSLFIGVAVIEWWRSDRNLLTSLLIAWLLIGIVLILIQRFSWWPYHFLILFPPAGILGVRGADGFCQYILGPEPKNTGRAMLASALLIFPGVAALAVPAEQKLKFYINTFVERAGTVEEFQRAISRDYEQVYRSTRFLLDEDARPGKIYVFGTPLYYHLSGREPALPIIGWPWEYFLQEQWIKLPNQLKRTHPPYIYIDKHSKKIMKQRGGGVQEFIESHYINLFADYKGNWFVIRSSPSGDQHASDPSTGELGVDQR